VKIVTRTQARAHLYEILAEVERTRESVTITKQGRPVAILIPATRRERKFGQLPMLVVPADFDDPLPGNVPESYI
jgi:prevent-host-death family protein